MSETGIEQSNASFHLRFLRNAALVNAESRGRNMYYRVQDKELLRLIGELAHWMNKALPNNVKSDAEIRSKSLRKRKGTPV
jgi:DNA-binding transcriptional ArsR family regulator